MSVTADVTGAPGLSALPLSAIAPARVGRLEGGRMVVAMADERECEALVAASCLLAPEPGDRVAVLTLGGERFVVAVLQRGSNAPATLAVEGGSALVLQADHVTIEARETLTLRGRDVRIRAKLLSVMADQATWVGRKLATVVERWTASATVHETTADTLSERAAYRTAVVDVADIVKAESRNVSVAGIAVESAATKLMTASDDLRMDAKRIAMG